MRGLWPVVPLSVLACLGAADRTARADGMPIKNGRFVGGPATVITLTVAQLKQLRAADEQAGPKVLILTEGQRASLQRSARAAPLRLGIYNTRKGETDCTCEAVNRGLWFAEGKVEVPHEYRVAEGDTPPAPGRPWIAAVAGAAGVCLLAAGVRRVMGPAGQHVRSKRVEEARC